MIRTENDYKRAVRERDEQAKRLKAQEQKLKKDGLARAELKRALDPVRSFHQDLVEEIKVYEAIKRGDLRAVLRFGTLGQQMIGLCIAKGLSQRELAARLGVHETQVSRDERNEYHGLTLDRANRIMEALGVRLVSSYVPVSA